MGARDPRDVGDSFADLFARWLDRHAKPYKKSWQADADLFERHLRARLGACKVADLARRDIINALDDIAAAASGIQANRCQSLVTATLNWALSEDLIGASPAAGIRKRGKNRPEREYSATMRSVYGGARSMITSRRVSLRCCACFY